MESIKVIRRKNLKFCVEQSGSPKAFLDKYAHFYEGNLSDAYLSQITGKGSDIGDRTAKKINKMLGKPENWLDTPHYLEAGIDTNVEAAPDIKGKIPLISWVQAGAFAEAIDTFQPGDAEEWLPTITKMSGSSFALRVKGISMEPKFQDGDIIYVDPEVAADSGKYVIVRLDDEQEVTFKQLVIEDGRKYLRPLNPAWEPQLIKINGNATICGVVVSKMVTF